MVCGDGSQWRARSKSPFAGAGESCACSRSFIVGAHLVA